MHIEFQVADRVHLLSHAHVNCYLIEDGSGLTLVDAGLPSMGPLLREAVETLGYEFSDIRAIVLTHGHFDHLGIARRLQEKWGTAVAVHPADARLAAHPYRYRPERNRLLYLLRHPGGWRPIGELAAAGALAVRGVASTVELELGVPLPVPGTPVALATPGHTDGHCVLWLPDRDTVLCGDALVTFDPYTGASGPQIVATAATSDSATALASLDAIADTGATTLLTGHGAPWRDGAIRAVERARAAGAH